MPHQTRKRQAEVHAFLAQNNFMNISTSRDGLPWCASVYYVHKKNRFFFFSNRNSRHIQHAAANPRAAANVSRGAEGWREIQGVQMSGLIEPVSSLEEKAQAISAYLKKFPFVKELINLYTMKSSVFSEKMTDMELYKFTATEVVYLNNAEGFGYREELELEA